MKCDIIFLPTVASRNFKEFDKMKKRIFALALCIITCLSVFALASCSDDEGSKGIHEILAPLEETRGPIKLQQTFEVLSGDEYFIDQDTSGGFLFTKEVVSNDETGSIIKSIYRLYSVRSGLIAEESVKPYDKTDSSDQVYDIAVYYSNKCAFLVKAYGEYIEEASKEYNYETGKYEWKGAFVQDASNCQVSVYDVYGNAFLSFEPDFDIDLATGYGYWAQTLFGISGEYMYYDKKVYKVEDNGEIKLFKDLSSLANDIKSLNLRGRFIEAGDKYIYVPNNSSNYTYVYFDNNFNYLRTFNYHYNSNERIEGFEILANGNIFITKNESLGKKKKGYDYKTVSSYSGETLYYKVSYELYDASADKFIDVKAPKGFIISEVEGNLDKDSYDESIVRNIATLNAVDDGYVSSQEKYFAMDNNGEMIYEIERADDILEVERVSANAVVVMLPYATNLYYNNKLVGSFDSEGVEYWTNSYIVYEDKILDYSLKEVYKIEDDYRILYVYDEQDLIIFATVEEDEENGGEKNVYYAWKSGDISKIDCDSLQAGPSFYQTTKTTTEEVESQNGQKEEKEIVTVTYYSASGEELFSYDNKDENVYTSTNILGGVLVKITSEKKEKSNGTEETIVTYSSYFAD